MPTNSYSLLYLQKKSIEKQYCCFKCNIINHGAMLVCKGTLQPLDCIAPYHIKITQTAGNAPKVYVINPKIKCDPKIHIYKGGNLCLFYPAEFTWKSTTSVASYMIPWINEWIIYYELYQISGKWEGPESPHVVID